jgi:hypothetical protein
MTSNNNDQGTAPKPKEDACGYRKRGGGTRMNSIDLSANVVYVTTRR